MRILAVGGGSGGHVTPVAAVLREIKRKIPDAEMRFWCDRNFASQAKALMSSLDTEVSVHIIFAGKLRRYNHLSFWQHITWPSLVLSNVKDIFFVFLGFIQSVIKMIAWRPDVVFTKGGYVCLPVGIAAKILGLPLVIHDSDAHPGLTNRVLAKWADRIATGAPLECYEYPASKTKYVGIPISKNFHPFRKGEVIQAKQKWGVEPSVPLIVITGGGLGATRINNTVIQVLGDILNLGSVILISGAGQYDELRSLVPPNSKHFQLYSFISKDMASLLGAADVVVTRAGATTILELAALAKPTILIPNAKLTGGHQLKNADVYRKAGAVAVVDEDEMLEAPKILLDTIQKLLENPSTNKKMATRLAAFSRPDAAKDVAEMIISAIK